MVDQGSPGSGGNGARGAASDTGTNAEAGRVREPVGPEAVAWRKWCVMAGAVMMLIALGLSLAVPVQRDMLYICNRSVMALGGALVAGGLLGFLQVEAKLLKQTVTAGGGFGVFIVLFLVNPPEKAAMAAASDSRRAEIDRILEFPNREGGDDESPQMLDQALHDEGFSDIDRFRVTASREDMDRVEGNLALRQRVVEWASGFDVGPRGSREAMEAARERMPRALEWLANSRERLPPRMREDVDLFAGRADEALVRAFIHEVIEADPG